MKKGFLYKYNHVAWLAVLGLFVLFMDFFTKAYVYHVLPFFDSCIQQRCFEIPIFHNFWGINFSIGLAFNYGAAWGMFADSQFILLAIRLLVILAMFIYLFFSNQKRVTDAPLVLIISGAIGNVIDFFLYGFVIDFLQFNLWGYNFPLFNLADTSITIGVIWLFLVSLFTRKKTTYSVSR